METAKKHKMTAQEAVSFDRFSIGNASLILGALEESGRCNDVCQPYMDIFTFNRWKAQGYSVMKGEHGFKVPVVRKVEVKNRAHESNPEAPEKKSISIANGVPLFCRCQVKLIEKKN